MCNSSTITFFRLLELSLKETSPLLSLDIFVPPKSIVSPARNKSFQRLDVVPRSYVSVVAGTIFWSTADKSTAPPDASAPTNLPVVALYFKNLSLTNAVARSMSSA